MKKHFLLIAATAAFLFTNAQTKNRWRTVAENEVSKETLWAEGDFKPSSYKLFALDDAAFRSDIKSAPVEKSGSLNQSITIISIPNADGSFMQYRIIESSVMQPELAAKYPGIKTYIGKGIENPGANLAFAVTKLGLFASITELSHPTYYINCLNKSKNIYEVNERNINDLSTQAFKCSLGQSVAIPESTEAGNPTPFKGNADDGKLRTYVLALCTNGEFSRFFMTGSEVTTSDSIATVLSAITIQLTRANQVYERDFGIRLVFAAKEDSIIYLNPSTDPFTSGNWNSQSQQTCDKKIGSANYDIGHVVTKIGAGGDGNAGCIGCVCRSGQKGGGYTAYSNPKLTEYFVIDYWTHEMGHQFGAYHTYSFDNENSGANVEPGSGSTIMGYAGITGSFTDVQAHSDDYFHSVSVAQISNYVKTGYGGTCDAETITGNKAPVVANPLADYYIPKTTPFMINATGTFSDADAGDVLTYTFEEIDKFIDGGTSSTVPKRKSTNGPQFRSLKYSTVQSRTFPVLSTILGGRDSTKWEVLPSVTRSMNFRVTARDNHAGGGNNKSDDMVITVHGDAGPFAITVQNTTSSTIWYGGDTKTITWDVANSDKEPINCANVKISLSVDNGNTFPYVLIESTPNDGIENVIIPQVNASLARIKVEAVDNIFFDINNAGFKIEEALPVTWLSFTAQKLNNAVILLNWSTTNETNNMYYEVERSSDAQVFEKIATVNAGNTPTLIQEYQYRDYKAIAGANYYRLKQVDADGKSSYSSVAKVILASDMLSWSVQPNPATTATTMLARKEMLNVQISLVDANGKMVYNVKHTKLNAGEQIIIPLHNIAKGIYVLRVQSDEGIRTEKISIQ